MPDLTPGNRSTVIASLLTKAAASDGSLKVSGYVSTNAAPPSLRAYPVGTLKPTLLTLPDQPVPCSMGVDGAVYGSTQLSSRRKVCRSSDGFATVELGADYSAVEGGGMLVQSVTRTHAGYVTVLSGGTGGAVYFSPTWGAVGAKVLTLAQPTTRIAIMWRHGLPGIDDIHMVGEYSQNIGNAHNAYRSLDGGQTWQLSISTVVVDAATNAHWHGFVYDPHDGMLYASNGDGDANRALYRSRKLGEPGSWIKIPNPASQFTTGGWEQPTLMIATEDGIALFPDTAVVPAVLSMKRDTNYVLVNQRKYDIELKLALTDQTSASQWFAMGPYAQVGNAAYAIVPKNQPVISNGPPVTRENSDEYFVVATGDSGRSWHPVWSVKLHQHGANVNMREGIVGPDANGYMYAHLYATVYYVAKFKVLDWVIG